MGGKSGVNDKVSASLPGSLAGNSSDSWLVGSLLSRGCGESEREKRGGESNRNTGNNNAMGVIQDKGRRKKAHPVL